MNIWLGGVWVGKEAANDMRIVVTPNGQFQTRSIRRCNHAWRGDVVQALTQSPWSKQKTEKVIGTLSAPLPSIEEKTDEPEPRQPVLLPTGDVDEEAEQVIQARVG